MKKILALVVVSLFLLGTNGCPLAPSPVAKTGQTRCYDVDGMEIACSGTGQDGELQKGVEWPNPRFTDNGDGTATDNLTDLVWLKHANCFGTRTWNDALSDCNGLASGSCELTDGSNAGDWRLPNKFELESLLDMGNQKPALPSGHPFTNVQFDHYWSSTTFANATGVAWVVNMISGNNYYDNKYYDKYVWPVRGGH
jgi:hypothetical protein